MTPITAQRRRGPELEAALLDAVWWELAETGYARLTMEGVAARANTGKQVLYRPTELAVLLTGAEPD